MTSQSETDLTIVPTGKFGARGERYEVFLKEELISAGWAPEFPACRALKERGMTGFVRFWRRGKPKWDLRMGIDWGAARCVVESARAGQRFAKWAPDPRFAKDEEDE